MLSGVQIGNGIQHVEYTWHCTCACIQKRRHLNAKTTIVKLYICINSCPQNKIDPPPKKKSNSSKENAHAGIAYSACTIPPLRHFFPHTHWLYCIIFCPVPLSPQGKRFIYKCQVHANYQVLTVIPCHNLSSSWCSDNC